MIVQTLKYFMKQILINIEMPIVVVKFSSIIQMDNDTWSLVYNVIYGLLQEVDINVKMSSILGDNCLMEPKNSMCYPKISSLHQLFTRKNLNNGVAFSDIWMNLLSRAAKGYSRVRVPASPRWTRESESRSKDSWEPDLLDSRVPGYPRVQIRGYPGP